MTRALMMTSDERIAIIVKEMKSAHFQRDDEGYEMCYRSDVLLWAQRLDRILKGKVDD